ncbi:MAG TPA: WXG100 family type VII secretion target [Actinospica sp.]|jgi:WXG100 family type VII secretion target|nr:WXG100 family type VII secretion target [Actinospica sp.]
MAEVLVTFAALAEAAQTIQSTYNNLNTKLTDLENQLKPVVSSWTGTASENYQQQQAKWNSAQQDLNTVLQAIGKTVEAAHDAYTQTESANAQAWQ